KIVTVSICLARLIESSRRRVPDIAVIRFAVVRFHAHMLWIDCAEMNPRADLQRFADQNILSGHVAHLQLGNPHLRPISAYLLFPFAQLCGRTATVARKSL